jgi:hypothetical protein
MADLTDRNATETLDRIRDGGQRLIFLALAGMDEVRRALEEGRFDDANARAREVAGKTHALAAAESTIGVFAMTQLIRASSLVQGMLVEGYGRVGTVDVGQHECESGADPHVVVTVRFETGPERTFDGTTELLVTDDHASG